MLFKHLDETHSDVFKTPYDNAVEDLSLSSIDESYQLAAVQESIQDSVKHSMQESVEVSVLQKDADATYSSNGNSSHIEDSSSVNETSPDSDEDQVDLVSSKDHSNVSISRKIPHGRALHETESSEEDVSKDSNPDESYHIRGKRLGSEEQIENDRDPNESYQVIQAGRRQKHLVIQSSGENSAEVSDSEEPIPKFIPPNDISDDSVRSPSPDESFHVRAKTNRRRIKNQILSSDDSDSDSESPGANLLTLSGGDRRSMKSNDTEEETETKNVGSEDTFEEPYPDSANDDSANETDFAPQQSTRLPSPEDQHARQDSGNGSSIGHVTRVIFKGLLYDKAKLITNSFSLIIGRINGFFDGS